jgi:hypothetical protein
VSLRALSRSPPSIYSPLNQFERVFRYHFESLDACYISYSEAPDNWLLDDGSRLPQRKMFEDCSYDANTRTFRATVRWREAPVEGSVRWDYRMVFSDDFCIIAAGESECFDKSGQLLRTRRFPHDLRYWRQRRMSTGLPGCVFIQGGLIGLASYHFPSDAGIESAYISYEAAPSSWLLDNGNPPPLRKAFTRPCFDSETRTFRATIDWSESSFGGSVKWEYTMVFASDYSHIIGGSVQCFSDATLPPSSESLYGRELIYELYVEEQAQMDYCLRQLRRV